jgi:hypothetical protein
MIYNALERNDGDYSSISIILQYNKHFPSELVSNGLDIWVGEEIHGIPLCWVMIIKLRSNALDVFFELIVDTSDTSRHHCHSSAGKNKNHHDAVSLIVISLVFDI